MDGDGIWVGEFHRPDTYRLIRLLGGGAEGEVWEAELALSKGGRRRVAVKILPADPSSGGLEWEAYGDLLKSLAAPGLVRVVDVFTGPVKHYAGDMTSLPPGSPPGGQRRHYVVMDFVEGVPLQRWMEENPNSSVSAQLALLATAASGLDELHAGVATGVAAVHGDIKPSNIVVDDRGTAVLVDLGLAQLVDGTRRRGLTPAYAAPELGDGEAPPTPASDRFAFAATAVHLLTGQLPAYINGHLDIDGVQAQLETTPALHGRDLLKDTLMAALASDPEDRPSALRPWLSSLTQAVSCIAQTVVVGTPAPAAASEEPHAPARPDRRDTRAASAVVAAPPVATPQASRAMASGPGEPVARWLPQRLAFRRWRLRLLPADARVSSPFLATLAVTAVIAAAGGSWWIASSNRPEGAISFSSDTLDPTEASTSGGTVSGAIETSGVGNVMTTRPSPAAGITTVPAQIPPPLPAKPATATTGVGRAPLHSTRKVPPRTAESTVKVVTTLRATVRDAGADPPPPPARNESEPSPQEKAVPGSVAWVRLSSPAQTTMVVDWGAAPEATLYRLSWVESPGGRVWVGAPPDYVEYRNGPVTLTGLRPGHSYVVSVTPLNDAGAGPVRSANGQTAS